MIVRGQIAQNTREAVSFAPNQCVPENDPTTQLWLILFFQTYAEFIKPIMEVADPVTLPSAGGTVAILQFFLYYKHLLAIEDDEQLVVTPPTVSSEYFN